MIRFLYDTAVFSYAFGRPHLYQEPCRRIVQLAGAKRLRGEASADLVQELLHQRFVSTRDRSVAAAQAREAASLCHLHEVRRADADRAISLFAESSRLHARDCLFAAVAINRGVGLILSPDRAFDELDSLVRLDPADSDGVDELVLPPRSTR